VSVCICMMTDAGVQCCPVNSNFTPTSAAAAAISSGLVPQPPPLNSGSWSAVSLHRALRASSSDSRMKQQHHPTQPCTAVTDTTDHCTVSQSASSSSLAAAATTGFCQLTLDVACKYFIVVAGAAAAASFMNVFFLNFCSVFFYKL